MPISTPARPLDNSAIFLPPTSGLPAGRMQFVETVVDLKLATELLQRARLVTPEGTVNLKQLNKRRLSPSLIRKFSDEMIDGWWRLTHQAIAILPDGGIHDGQHRLLALLDAYRRNPYQQPVTFMICYNADPAVFAFVDKGKRRSPSDDFGIDDLPSAPQLSQAARLLWFWLATRPGRERNAAEARIPVEPYKWAKIEVPSNRLLQVAAEHPGLQDYLEHSLSVARRSYLTPSSVITSRYIVTQAGNDPEKLYEFLELIGSGQNMPYDWHPAWTLRDWSIRSRTATHKVTRGSLRLAKGPLHLRLIIQMWNHVVEGNKVEKISYKKEGLIPEALVMPEQPAPSAVSEPIAA
ncbi:hypothetical protein AB0G15_06000 [Streptosporangium sp. NPDC023825]|uniref:hypothetical protein n=1 Tax=Streptosporangium sp. NPDC023825 TaxID=3154909 RepID=UPI00342A1D9F